MSCICDFLSLMNMSLSVILVESSSAPLASARSTPIAFRTLEYFQLTQHPTPMVAPYQREFGKRPAGETN